MLNKNVICSECGEVFDMSLIHTVSDQYVCENCHSELYTRCARCDREIHIDDNEGDDTITLCNDCYSYYFTRCSDCSRILNNEDAYYLDGNDDEPYCYSCYHDIIDDQESNYIHEYSYKPSPLFYGDEGIFMGIELEIDNGGCNSSNASSILDVLNTSADHVYIKRDGSIDDGFELVSHPMTYNYHLNNMPWERTLRYCASLGYRSHQTTTCGLHIHVGRIGLGKDKVEQESTTSKILYFIEKNWDEVLKFSRRNQAQIDRWARRYGYKECPKDVLDYAKELPNGRYSAINLLNTATIEFRLFRGTLKYKTFIATLQFVEEICKVSKAISEDEMKSLSWQDFVGSIKDKPELIEYLKLHSLYINEPYNDEEDDI